MQGLRDFSADSESGRNSKPRQQAAEQIWHAAFVKYSTTAASFSVHLVVRKDPAQFCADLGPTEVPQLMLFARIFRKQASSVSTVLADRSRGNSSVISCNSAGNQNSARPNDVTSFVADAISEFCVLFCSHDLPAERVPALIQALIRIQADAVSYSVQADCTDFPVLRKCVPLVLILSQPPRFPSNFPSPATQACVGRRLLFLLTPCATLS